MNSKTKTIRNTTLRFARALIGTLPSFLLGLLASGCAERFQLGEVNQGIDQPQTALAVENAPVIVDGAEDADARVSVAPWGPGVGDVDGDGYDDWLDGFTLAYGGPRPADGVFRAADGEGPTFVFRDDAEWLQVQIGVGDIDADGHDDLVFRSSVGVTQQYEVSPNESAEERAAALAWAMQLWPLQRAFLWYGDSDRRAGERDLEQMAASLRARDNLVGKFSRELTERLRPEHAGYMAWQELDLTPVGDLDADGFDDLALTATFHWRPFVSAPGDSPDQERRESVSYVYYGRPERFAAPEPSARLAGVAKLQALGDLNGDGHAELEAWTADDVYLIAGSAARMAGNPSIDAIGKPLHTVPGMPVEQAGDLDGDGFDDLVVAWDAAAPLFRYYLVYGSPSLLAAPLERSAASAIFEVPPPMASVTPAGDWNGDGVADLLLTHGRLPDESVYIAGQEVRIIPGAPGQRYTGHHELSVQRPKALVSSDNVAHADLIGDVDGDGFPDLFFADMESLVPPRTDRGIFVKFGSPHFDTAPIH